MQAEVAHGKISFNLTYLQISSIYNTYVHVKALSHQGENECTETYETFHKKGVFVTCDPACHAFFSSF